MIVKWAMSSRPGQRFFIPEIATKGVPQKEYKIIGRVSPREYYDQEGVSFFGRPSDWWKFFYYKVEPVETTTSQNP